jgi:putative DNA primase/helicase
LNTSAFRIGRLVGAEAIGIEDACRPLEEAGVAMYSYDARRPWTAGYIRYKVLRAVSQGATSPDPTTSIIRRSAASNYAYVTVAVPPAPGDNPNLTDQGNGERLAKRYGDEIRHCPELAPKEGLGSWLVWNGRHWAADATMAVQEMAKETVRAIALETPPVVEIKTNKAGEESEGKNLTADWAHKSETALRIKNMIEMARSISNLQSAADEYDSDPYLLNVLNGTIDLSNGSLRPAERNDYLTQCAGVAYDPEATCPTWEKFMLDCMDGKAHLVEYHQVWAGYSLTGDTSDTSDTSEQKLMLHHGEGANGKSTYLDVLAHPLGSYAKTASPATFMEADRESGDTPNPALAALRGARMVVAIETNSKQSLNMAVIKAVTGCDPITVRNLYTRPITFRPQFKLMMATNQLPRISDQDHGAWRRFLTSPWTVGFGLPGSPTIDPHIKDKLLAELPGILNWALAGCAKWMIEKKLSIPPEVSAATAEYRETSDDLQGFFEEVLDLAPEQTIGQSELFKVYEAWNSSTHPLGKRNFNHKVMRPGVTKIRTHGKRAWQGLAYTDTGREIANRVLLREIH